MGPTAPGASSGQCAEPPPSEATSQASTGGSGSPVGDGEGGDRVVLGVAGSWSRRTFPAVASKGHRTRSGTNRSWAQLPRNAGIQGVVLALGTRGGGTLGPSSSPCLLVPEKPHPLSCCVWLSPPGRWRALSKPRTSWDAGALSQALPGTGGWHRAAGSPRRTQFTVSPRGGAPACFSSGKKLKH